MFRPFCLRYLLDMTFLLKFGHTKEAKLRRLTTRNHMRKQKTILSDGGQFEEDERLDCRFAFGKTHCVDSVEPESSKAPPEPCMEMGLNLDPGLIKNAIRMYGRKPGHGMRDSITFPPAKAGEN